MICVYFPLTTTTTKEIEWKSEQAYINNFSQSYGVEHFKRSKISYAKQPLLPIIYVERFVIFKNGTKTFISARFLMKVMKKTGFKSYIHVFVWYLIVKSQDFVS